LIVLIGYVERIRPKWEIRNGEVDDGAIVGRGEILETLTGKVYGVAETRDAVAINSDLRSWRTGIWRYIREADRTIVERGTSDGEGNRVARLPVAVRNEYRVRAVIEVVIEVRNSEGNRVSIRVHVRNDGASEIHCVV